MSSYAAAAARAESKKEKAEDFPPSPLQASLKAISSLKGFTKQSLSGN